MARTSLFASAALALQAATAVYAHPHHQHGMLQSRQQAPGPEPAVFGTPDYGNATSVLATVSSPHFLIWLGTEPESSGVESLKWLEAAYDCFVRVQGWRTTGLSNRGAEPYYKTEYQMVSELGGPYGTGGLSHPEEKTGRTWISLSYDTLTSPTVAVHEYGHALHYQQNTYSWMDLHNMAAWVEPVAQLVADTYMTGDVCADSRAKFNQSEGDTLFRPYSTIENSYMVLVDGRLQTRGGNLYDAWPFLHYLVVNPDNLPRMGRDAILTLIRETTPGDSKQTLMHVLQRVLGGGATVVQDLVAKYWARMAYADIGHPRALRAFDDNKAFLNMQNFERVSEGDRQGTYRVKRARAPRYMGASMAPLKIDPATGAKVAVNVTADDAAASFTATLSVRDTVSRRVRYVALPGGRGEVDVAAGEEATVVVANTPAELIVSDARIEYILSPDNSTAPALNPMFQGMPFTITVTGATVNMY